MQSFPCYLSFWHLHNHIKRQFREFNISCCLVTCFGAISFSVTTFRPSRSASSPQASNVYPEKPGLEKLPGWDTKNLHICISGKEKAKGEKIVFEWEAHSDMMAWTYLECVKREKLWNNHCGNIQYRLISQDLLTLLVAFCGLIFDRSCKRIKRLSVSNNFSYIMTKNSRTKKLPPKHNAWYSWEYLLRNSLECV